jgi:hypothetical protein
VSKKQAEKTWGKLMVDEVLFQEIIGGLENAIKNDSRFREVKYTPHASSWLNAEGWRDEHSESSKDFITGHLYRHKGIECEPEYHDPEKIFDRIMGYWSDRNDSYISKDGKMWLDNYGWLSLMPNTKPDAELKWLDETFIRKYQE